MGRVEGKVAIVTGAASGLGRAQAMALAREGASVVVTDVNVAAGLAVAESIGGLFIEHDVRREDGWQSVIDKTLERHGRLDILVNNAGIVVVADIENTTLDQYRQVNAVNAEGVFLGCKFAIAAMKDSGGGSIVNLSSIAARRSHPQVFSYVAAKGAVRAMSMTVAGHCLDRGYPIRCNSIYPGLIDTPMVAEVGRQLGVEGGFPGLGRPEDVAALVLYLAADESRHVTGAEFVIDFGTTIR